jgi:hypothetical protein
MSPLEVVLLLAPTAVSVGLLILVLIYLATKRPETEEYRRLTDRVRHLEADHRTDITQIKQLQDELFWLSRLVWLLANQLEQLGAEIPPDVEEFLRRQPRWRPQSSRATLVQYALAQYLDQNELAQLAFELGIDFDDLPGSTKEQKARELALFADRRGGLEAVTERIQALRPNAPTPWLGGRGPP